MTWCQDPSNRFPGNNIPQIEPPFPPNGQHPNTFQQQPPCFGVAVFSLFIGQHNAGLDINTKCSAVFCHWCIHHGNGVCIFWGQVLVLCDKGKKASIAKNPVRSIEKRTAGSIEKFTPGSIEKHATGKIATTMNSTILILLASGILGILTHNLMKIDKLNRRTDGCFNAKQFFKLEWASIMISFCVVSAALIGRYQISELYNAGKWLFLAFYFIGLGAQSIAGAAAGRSERLADLISDKQARKDNT
jgi:hypothetical protein